MGRRLGFKDGREITVKELESLESALIGLKYAESTITAKMSILKDMLVYTGNKEAQRYTLLCSMQPAKDSVYLTEEQMAAFRMKARELSNVHELLFSLMADDGCRPVDIERMTLKNARELLDTGKSVILGKGRKGGKEGLLVLSPMTAGPLKRYLALSRTLKDLDSFDQLMLNTWRGKTVPMTRRVINNRTTELREVTGFYVKQRDFRKTCGNRVYKKKRDVALAAMILRHSNPGTTFKHYIGADLTEMESVQRELADLCPDRQIQSSEDM
ncbi:MAG: tyrosine-type recombinase/integrase [Methanomassiliicoccales archaeon]|nr:tyrosine-type recombinase/integrase [Methanomassiliicoccales archaeon]